LYLAVIASMLKVLVKPKIEASEFLGEN